MNRTLTLKSETLAALTDTELHAVVGGAKTTPVNECLNISYEFTCLDCITRRGAC
jgi:hypothetical protein